jgi:hypothetical protein
VALANIFDLSWPSLEQKFAQIAACPSPTPSRKRDNTAILEEILGSVRNLERRYLLEEHSAERLRQLEAIQSFLLPKFTPAAQAQLLKYLQDLLGQDNLRNLADLYAARMEGTAVPEPDSPIPKESTNESEGSA